MIVGNAISPYSINVLGGGSGVAVLSSTASGVDGLFQVTILLASANSSFSTSNVNVANGTCQYVWSADNITWTAFIMPDGVGSVAVNVGASNVLTITLSSAWQFLYRTSARAYYDFRELVGFNGDTINTYDPALKDLCIYGRDLTKINAGVVNSLSAGVNGYRDITTSALSTSDIYSTVLNQNFSVNFRWKPTDGQSVTVQHICGNKDATNTGLIISIQTNGKLRINYQGFIWDSTNVVFANGVNAASYFDIHFDFTTDVLTVRQDGASVAGSFTTSNIASVNPASYACTVDFYIGSFNNNGSAFSNTDSAQLDYFTITALQTTPFTEVASYLEAKKPTLEYLASLTDATYLKYPHDVLVSRDMTKAFVSGKGDASLTTVDGSFGIVDLSVPATPTILGGYASHGDQKDGETVLILSSSRVMHFVDDACLLFNVSNPASPTLVKSVTNANGVVNGAFRSTKNSNYVFGANKGGFIDVFDVSDIDNFTLVGSWDVGSIEGMIGPHDIEECLDNEYFIFCSKTTGANFGMVRAFNGSTLISIGSWAIVGKTTSAAAPNLTGTNRVKRVTNNGSDVAILFQLQGGGGGNNVVMYDITTKATPVYKCEFSLTQTSQRGATGGNLYLDRYAIVGNDEGIRLLDVKSSLSTMTQKAAYFNATAFSLGTNNNIHDADWWFSGQNRYLIITAHNEGIAIFKVNRI